MGYYTRRGKVEENRAFIDDIFRAIEDGRTVRLTCQHVLQVSKLKYQVNNILRACALLVDECGGRYAMLRQMTTVSEDLKNPAVVIKPKTGGFSVATALAHITSPDERDALRILEEKRDQDIVFLDFAPSPTYPGDDWLHEQVGTYGYDLEIKVQEDEFLLSKGAKPVEYIATRREKPKAFDLLKRHTPSANH